MGVKDGWIIDASARFRNIDRESVPVLLAEFVARGLPFYIWFGI